MTGIRRLADVFHFAGDTEKYIAMYETKYSLTERPGGTPLSKEQASSDAASREMKQSVDSTTDQQSQNYAKESLDEQTKIVRPEIREEDDTKDCPLMDPVGADCDKADCENSGRASAAANDGQNNGGSAKMVSSKSSDDTPEAEKTKVRLDFYCSGTCSRSCGIYLGETYWHCSDCFNVDFCIDCKTQLEEGRMREGLCSQDHKLLRIQTGLERAPRGKVYCGEDLIDMEDFLESVRKEWEL